MASRKVAVCNVEGCDRTDIDGHGWCGMHYARWRKHGDPGGSERQRLSCSGECQVDGCDRVDIHAGGFCKMHYNRQRRHGDPGAPERQGRLPGPHNHGRKPDDQVGYVAVHQRLRRLRGPAEMHPCAHCPNMAAHWAYDHQDPDERSDEHGPNRGLLYSPDPERYLALCSSCHRRFDLGRFATLTAA